MSTSQERVAVETPRGTIRAGTVVDRELEADANRCRYRLTVDVDGSLFRAWEDDVGRSR